MRLVFVLALIPAMAWGQYYVTSPSAAAPPAGPDSVVIVVADSGAYSSLGGSGYVSWTQDCGTDDNRAVVILVVNYAEAASYYDSVKVGTVHADRGPTFQPGGGVWGGLSMWVAYGVATGSQTVTAWVRTASATNDVGGASVALSNAAQTFTAADTANDAGAQGNNGACSTTHFTLDIPSATGSLTIMGGLFWGGPWTLSMDNDEDVQVNAKWLNHPAPRVIITRYHDGSSPTDVSFCDSGESNFENYKLGINIRVAP